MDSHLAHDPNVINPHAQVNINLSEADQLRQQVLQLTSMVQGMMMTQQQQTAAPVNNNNINPKNNFKKPPTYDGKDRSFCSTFISHINLHFMANPSSFTNDQAKVMYAASLLRERAFKWFEPYLHNNDLNILADYNNFVTELLANLGDPDRLRTTTRKLRHLTQLSSAAAYATEFYQLASFLNWNDDALYAQFYEGLKSEVKDALAVAPRPITCQELSNLAINLDNRLHERKMERGRPSANKSPNFSAPGPPYVPPVTITNPAASTAPVPMEIDSIQSKPYKTLTPEERQRRITNNLCLYCEQPGHRVAVCPNKPNGQQHTVNAIAKTQPDTVKFILVEDNQH